MTKPVPGGIGISHYHPHPNVARSRRFTAHSGLRCAPSFVVSPSGLRLRVSRGRQIVPCTSAYAHSAPPGGRLPKRSGSVTVANCLSALQAPPTPRLTLHSDFYAPKEGAPSGLHFTQSRHTSDIPPALHRDYTLSTRYTGRRGASKVVSIVDPPGRWKSARFTHTFLRPPSDCLSSQLRSLVGRRLRVAPLTTHDRYGLPTQRLCPPSCRHLFPDTAPTSRCRACRLRLRPQTFRPELSTLYPDTHAPLLCA